MEKMVTFILVIISSSVGVAAYSFQTFEQRDHAKEVKADTEKHLDRLELKMDELKEILMRKKSGED